MQHTAQDGEVGTHPRTIVADCWLRLLLKSSCCRLGAGALGCGLSLCDHLLRQWLPRTMPSNGLPSLRRRVLDCAGLLAHACLQNAVERIARSSNAVCRLLSAASRRRKHQADATVICRRWRCIACFDAYRCERGLQTASVLRISRTNPSSRKPCSCASSQRCTAD